jgi:hypothetical protein
MLLQLQLLYHAHGASPILRIFGVARALLDVANFRERLPSTPLGEKGREGGVDS